MNIALCIETLSLMSSQQSKSNLSVICNYHQLIEHYFAIRTDFIITCSIDGHIKFWKKQERGIEFVKHYRGHLGNVQDVAVNSSGKLLCTLSNDKSLKVFDVVNFGNNI